MYLLPAIDLMAGEAVRLEQGDPNRKTVYSSDPVAMARRWVEAGADWLHIVDLDAALDRGSNLEWVASIAQAVDVPCEVGGGVRTHQRVEALLDAGVSRVVVGTRAAEALDFVAAIAARHGGERVAVGIDARDGKVSVRGWTETTGLEAVAFAREVEATGAQTIIYTDIATDGMFTGPNYQGLASIRAATGCDLLASGGVASIDDLRQLAATPGITGAIIGKALYDGRITGNLREQLAAR